MFLGNSGQLMALDMVANDFSLLALNQMDDIDIGLDITTIIIKGALSTNSGQL